MYKHVNVNFCITTQIFTYTQYYWITLSLTMLLIIR